MGARMSETPAFSTTKQVDVESVNGLQKLLLFTSVPILGAAIMAVINVGWDSFYAITFLLAGLGYFWFSLRFPKMIREKTQGQVFCFFKNRLELHRGGDVLEVIPYSDIQSVGEQRTHTQREAGLTTVIVQLYDDAELSQQRGEETDYLISDVRYANKPADHLIELVDTYNAQRKDEKGSKR